MSYKPGDVANGHVLGADNVWHPLAAVPPGARARTYGERYGARWKWAVLVIFGLTCVAFLPRLATDGVGPFLIDLIVAGGLTALVLGSLIDLIVAAFPDRRSPGAKR